MCTWFLKEIAKEQSLSKTFFSLLICLILFVLMSELFPSFYFPKMKYNAILYY